MLVRRARLLPWYVAVLTLLTTAASNSCAQAAPTASEALQINIFAAYARLNPDYGTAMLNGLTFGLDFSHPIRTRLVSPALELRANYAGETIAAGEQVAMGGVRLGSPILSTPRLKPYVNFLVGAGQIDFPNNAPTYSRDNSVVLNYGAGVDYVLERNFSLKLEFQHQNWTLGRQTADARFTLTPSSYNIGLSYRIPALRH